jgi:hypothetical protein
LAKAKKSLSDDLSRIFKSKQKNHQKAKETKQDEDTAIQDYSIPL